MSKFIRYRKNSVQLLSVYMLTRNECNSFKNNFPWLEPLRTFLSKALGTKILNQRPFGSFENKIRVLCQLIIEVTLKFTLLSACHFSTTQNCQLAC